MSNPVAPVFSVVNMMCRFQKVLYRRRPKFWKHITFIFQTDWVSIDSYIDGGIKGIWRRSFHVDGSCSWYPVCSSRSFSTFTSVFYFCSYNMTVIFPYLYFTSKGTLDEKKKDSHTQEEKMWRKDLPPFLKYRGYVPVSHFVSVFSASLFYGPLTYFVPTRTKGTRPFKVRLDTTIN